MKPRSQRLNDLRNLLCSSRHAGYYLPLVWHKLANILGDSFNRGSVKFRRFNID